MERGGRADFFLFKNNCARLTGLEIKENIGLCCCAEGAGSTSLRLLQSPLKRWRTVESCCHKGKCLHKHHLHHHENIKQVPVYYGACSNRLNYYFSYFSGSWDLTRRSKHERFSEAISACYIFFLLF